MYHFMTCSFLEIAQCPVRIDSYHFRKKPGIQTWLARTEWRRSTTCATTSANSLLKDTFPTVYVPSIKKGKKTKLSLLRMTSKKNLKHHTEFRILK